MAEPLVATTSQFMQASMEKVRQECLNIVKKAKISATSNESKEIVEKIDQDIREIKIY